MNARSADLIDPVTLEVVRNRLEGIANEMQFTLLHSSFSPIVKEAMDCSAALFTAGGDTIAQATALPIHLATMIPALAAVLKAFPLAEMHEGDVFILNDPYCGGTHLPDITLFMPVFAEGVPIAFSVTTVHHQDMGGMTPGSIPTNATEIYQEGLRIPPLRYMEKGCVNETLAAMLRLNIRIPEMFMGDLNAQLSACTVGARNLGRLVQSRGSANVTAIFRQLLDRSEAMTRQALLTLPQGTFHYTDWLDNDGVELDKRVKIQVAVTNRNGSIHFDLTGTSPQVKGPMNCVPSGSLAAAYYAVRALTDASIPTNGGCFRPVSLFQPPGSLVNPIAPAPVNARTATIKRMCGAFVSAFAEAAPNRVPAASAGTSLMMVFGGQREDGTAFIISELVAAGTGASAGSDGVDCLQTDGSNSMNMPVEAFGLDAPIRVRRFGLRTDSGGTGRFRGGLGVVREYEMLGDEIRFTHRGERHYTGAKGSSGGGQGGTAWSVIRRADGREEVIASKCVTTLSRGDRLLIQTPGGGGFGDPRQRDRDLVRRDIESSKISRQAARDIYGFEVS